MTQPLTLETFAAMVKAMRDAQRTYYRKRLISMLEDAKRLEKSVDDVLRQIRPPRRRDPLPGQRSFLENEFDDD